MKKILLCCLIASVPWIANAADVNINLGNVRVDTPGGSITFGNRNERGYYWDGYEYRDPAYWKKHNGNKGQKYYTGNGNKGGNHCPPGQAKKGNC